MKICSRYLPRGDPKRPAATTRQVGQTPMKFSHDRILTSHAGSLPRPDALIEANRARDGLG